MIVMPHHMHSLRTIAAGAVFAGIAAVSPAQDVVSRGPGPGVFIQALPGPCGDMAAPPGAAGTQGIVTGAPYSATGRSETVQTLADGNRIVRSNTTRYFRDSRGRTRTEYVFSAVGPIALHGSSSLIVIDDPTTAKRVVLHPEIRMAMEMPRMACGMGTAAFAAGRIAPSAGAESGAGAVTFSAAVPAPAPHSGDVLYAAAPPDATTSPLPERTIRGLRALGKRTESSIPAGQMGNELPIVSKSETWYSPELQVVLSATHRDPLVGDTTYQLVDIVRKEPDANLFAIPRDYTQRSMPHGPRFEMAVPPQAVKDKRED
jgi:hypothetical protein